MGLSRRAYAESRKARGLPGGSDKGVRQAITAGRISLLPDGTIDPARADREWDETTDHSKRPGGGGEAPASPVPVGPSREDDPVPSGAMTLSKVKTGLGVVQLQRQQLRLKVEKKELVDKVKAEKTAFEFMRRERDHWQQLPARVAAQMAAELGCDAHRLERLLDGAIREHLRLATDTRIEIGGGGV